MSHFLYDVLHMSISHLTVQSIMAKRNSLMRFPYYENSST